MLGQVIPRGVRFLRFPAGGLFCSIYTFRDGPTEDDRVLIYFCDPVRGFSSVNTTGNSAYITFESDYTQSGAGFELEWSSFLEGKIFFIFAHFTELAFFVFFFSKILEDTRPFRGATNTSCSDCPGFQRQGGSLACFPACVILTFTSGATPADCMSAWPVADQGFPRQGGTNLSFGQFYLKTAWKWRNFGRRGGTRPSHPP